MSEQFIADIHIHSKYSRATAKNLDLEHIYQAALIKGISVIGTGDFTFPAWIAEIEEKLEPAEPGLFKLKQEIADKLNKNIPESCRGNKVRFILQTEISSIYKKNDRVRKNHNLIFFPGIESVQRFNSKLDKIGNIKSDGRPILGLSAENLLELMLNVDDTGFFIPAHIWTPWFSMFGSKSGFDSINECFGSLSKYIFAAETGLSSDLPMNWRIKDLDNLSFVSNSDAHSPRFVGRNASIFNTELSYFGMRDALKNKDLKKYSGTIDMHPELGKYHFDGHRKCNVCLNPVETLKLDGICPKCGKPMTLGVLNRVQKLADRQEGYIPENRHGYKTIVPLADILSEIFEVGPNTKTVNTNYDKAVETLGPELEILLTKDIKDIKKANIPLLSKAIEKIRKGKVSASPGFDGEFGKIKIFTTLEKLKLKGEDQTLFGTASIPKGKKSQVSINKPAAKQTTGKKTLKKRKKTQKLNKEQTKIVLSHDHPLIVEAGPGTGKTRTLTEKIVHLISKQNISSSSILALTFTNKAANEMKQRIGKMLRGKNKHLVCTATFHSFCLMILKESSLFKSEIADNDTRESFIKQACKNTGIKPSKADLIIQKEKQNLNSFKNCLKTNHIHDIWKKYETLMAQDNLVDYEDLILLAVNLLRENNDILRQLQQRFTHIFVDEYQDINKAQYILIKLIADKGENLMVIGDPDQSIYGFRGSDNKYFKQFAKDFPSSKKITLTENYRSTQTILDASFQLITNNDKSGTKQQIFSAFRENNAGNQEKIIMMEAMTDKAEAVSVGKMIETLVGGISFLSIDSLETKVEKEYSFSDFAILFRTKKQALVFEKIFEKANIPFQSVSKKSSDQTMDNLQIKMHDQDFFESKAEKVSLMTIHASKGLEFPVVFVTGLEETLIPFSMDGTTIDDIEEEKRLFYVAMTRAEDILCLTHAKKRMIFGKTCDRKKSRFLQNIEDNLKHHQSNNFKKQIKPKIAEQLDLFNLSDSGML